MRHDAINNLYPEVHNQSDNECFDIEGNPVTVDEDKVKTEIARLQTEYDAQAYARNRKEEYDVLNQFELISDDDVNGTTTHKDAIAAIKAKWPKDNSGPVQRIMNYGKYDN